MNDDITNECVTTIFINHTSVIVTREKFVTVEFIATLIDEVDIDQTLILFLIFKSCSRSSILFRSKNEFIDFCQNYSIELRYLTLEKYRNKSSDVFFYEKSLE